MPPPNLTHDANAVLSVRAAVIDLLRATGIKVE